MEPIRNQLDRAHAAYVAGNPAESEAMYRSILATAPDTVPALVGLAAILSTSGRLEEASLLEARAYIQPPWDGKPHKILATCHYRLGQFDEAARCYRAWLAEDPDNEIARHHLAACSGQGVPDRAPDRYVAALFDGMADQFDHRLVSILAYDGPGILRSILADIIPADKSRDILDAGCGTGLCGPVLAPMARRLTGVDLSQAMLDKARARGVYDRLIHGELTAFLQNRPAGIDPTDFDPTKFDLIVMADSLIYFGDLGGVFDAVAGSLRPGGLFAFTLELLPQDDAAPELALRPSGRYAHGTRHWTRCLAERGFHIRRSEAIVIRQEFCQPIHGVAVLAEVPAADGNRLPPRRSDQPRDDAAARNP